MSMINIPETYNIISDGSSDLVEKCFMCKTTHTTDNVYPCEVCDHIFCEDCMGIDTRIDKQVCDTCEADILQSIEDDGEVE